MDVSPMCLRCAKIMTKFDRILLIVIGILMAILIAVLLWVQSSFSGLCYGL